MNGKVVITEGIIGVGKTTFSECLSRHLEAYWMKEPDETNGNPYLSMFYNNQTRWAFTMQLHLLNTRYRMHQNAQWMALQQKSNVVLDRSYFGDTAFARLQKKMGTMTTDEFETYALCYQNMTSTILLPHICVHLVVSPTIAQQRVKKRMEKQTGRVCENVIDIKYLTDLQTEESHMISQLEAQGVKVISLNWNENMTIEEIDTKAREVALDICSHKPPNFFIDLHRRTM